MLAATELRAAQTACGLGNTLDGNASLGQVSPPVQ